MERIALILDYLNGKLDEEEKVRFETRLREDADWAKEVSSVQEELNYQRLSDWLAGRLSESEGQSLEEELKVNPELQQQLEEVKSIAPVLDAVHQNTILNEVKEIANQKTAPIPLQNHWRKRWLIAASFLLIVMLAGYLFYLPAQYSNAALAHQYFEAYPAQGNLLNLEEEVPILASYKNGAIAYDQQDFQKAITYFQKIPKVSPFYNNGQFYQANAHLALNQSNEAIRILSEQLANQPATSAKSRLQWYLALAHLQAQEESKAIAQLKELAKQESDLFYQKQAKQLITKLEATWRSLPGVK